MYMSTESKRKVNSPLGGITYPCTAFGYGNSGVARAMEPVGHHCACAKGLTTPTN